MFKLNKAMYWFVHIMIFICFKFYFYGFSLYDSCGYLNCHYLHFSLSLHVTANKRMVGTVITQPGGTTTAVIGQQQHGQQYGQQPGFSQPASDNASYPPPYKQ